MVNKYQNSIMAKLNIEGIIDHVDRDFRRAFEATLREHFRDQEYNSRAVFKTFKNEIRSKIRVWETVPNKYIRSE